MPNIDSRVSALLAALNAAPTFDLDNVDEIEGLAVAVLEEPGCGPALRASASHVVERCRGLRAIAGQVI